jgi:NAD+ diphosphatase
LEISEDNLKFITTAPNNYFYKNVPYRTMDIFYECSLEQDSISVNAKDEIEELVWIKRSEINLDKIGFVSIRKVISDKYFK